MHSILQNVQHLVSYSGFLRAMKPQVILKHCVVVQESCIMIVLLIKWFCTGYNLHKPRWHRVCGGKLSCRMAGWFTVTSYQVLHTMLHRVGLYQHPTKLSNAFCQNVRIASYIITCPSEIFQPHYSLRALLLTAYCFVACYYRCVKVQEQCLVSLTQ